MSEQCSDGTECVPADDLRELVDEWKELESELAGSEGDYNRGLAEGARSAALELHRLIERSVSPETDH